MSGYGDGPPLTDSGRRCDCVLGFEFCPISCARARHQSAREGRDIVRDVAFVLRRYGRMHHSTARALARVLQREGLLYGLED